MLRALTLTVVVVAVAAGTWSPDASGASCKKLKETKGCVLPSGASYQFSQSDSNEINISVDRGKAQVDLRSNCAHEMGHRFRFKSVPRIGRTYRFSHQKNVTSELQDGITVTYTYTIALTVKIVSATKATTTGSATATAPAVPAQGSFGGEDAFSSDCSLKRTLKRAMVE